MALRKRAPPRIIISGAPASGKGTQCEYIKEEFNVVHLSTGDMLRDEVRRKTEIGLKAQEYMNQGKLVPDSVIIEIVLNRIRQPDCVENGWLLDGFPRTDAQAAAMHESGVTCDVFVHLDVPDEALVDRVVGRRSDPVTGKIYHMTFNPPPEEIKDRLVQRADDTVEKVKTRIAAFHQNMGPLLERYSRSTVTVDGNRKAGHIWSDLYGSIARTVKLSIVFVLGGPKSGKRSYCKLLSTSFDYVYISPKDLMARNGWRDSHKFLAEDMVKLILTEMETSSSKKFIIDAFPRDSSDLKLWFDMVGESCIIDHVVYLETPEDVARQRLATEEPQLSPQEVEARFKIFQEETLPVIATLKWLGKVREHQAVTPVHVGFKFLAKYFERKNRDFNSAPSSPKTLRVGGSATAIARTSSKSSSAPTRTGTAGATRDDSTAQKEGLGAVAHNAEATPLGDYIAPIHERTLAILKPDVVIPNKTEGGLQKIFQTLLETHREAAAGAAGGVGGGWGITIASYKLVQMPKDIAAQFYDVHKEKPFFSDLVTFMSGAPCLVLILDGRDVMMRWRAMMGPADSLTAKRLHPQSIRAQCGTSVIHNAVHGSDSSASAFREIEFWTTGAGSSIREIDHDKYATYGISIPRSLMTPTTPAGEAYAAEAAASGTAPSTDVFSRIRNMAASLFKGSNGSPPPPADKGAATSSPTESGSSSSASASTSATNASAAATTTTPAA